MPCYEPRNHAGWGRADVQVATRGEQHIRRALTAQIDDLTELLCSLCTSVQRRAPELIADFPALAKWWEEHQAQDAEGARIAEKVAANGVASLTHEERTLYYVRQRRASATKSAP